MVVLPGRSQDRQPRGVDSQRQERSLGARKARGTGTRSQGRGQELGDMRPRLGRGCSLLLGASDHEIVIIGSQNREQD